MTDKTSVLIVGAGPTGLNLALRLARAGVAFRIIDQHPGPGRESRALAVHARTLEFYAQLGLADGIVARGTRMRRIHLLDDGEDAGGFSLGDMGEGLSPFPFVLDFPQDEHEAFLGEALAAAGVTIEWNTSLVTFAQDDGGVTAILATADGQAPLRADWLAGCDGARSRVRDTLGVGFPGGTYAHLYYVADVSLAAGASDDVYLALGRDNFALRMPARGGAMERLIGFLPDRPADAGAASFEDVRALAERLLAVRVANVNWFSTYRVHHRVADRFRIGRVFLLGDAGHLHSPAGGQGMNTGIGDAVNLAWKMAAVVAGEAAPALLDSYEPERIAFARRLVATTDRVFQAVVAGGLTGAMVRGFVMPQLIPAVTSVGIGRRAVFRLVSQIGIDYRDSPLSSGRAGAIAAGDRLPWCPAGDRGADNFAGLDGRGWQLQVHGAVAPALAAAADALGLAVAAFPWRDVAGEAGFARDAAYLVRPDMHVGLAWRDQDPARLRHYVADHGLRFGA